MNNFILICIDCLRFDSLERSLGPSSLSNISRGKHLFFRSAFTTAPWTYPATNSLLTGLYPHHHGAYQEAVYKNSVREPWPSRLDPDIPTVFSVLGEAGFYTLGISTIFWALNNNCEYRGCDRIIRSEEQDVFYKNVKAEWVAEAFREVHASEIGNTPFFAYLHFCDLHRPFDIEVALAHASEPIQIMEGIEDWDIRSHLDDPKKTWAYRENKRRLYEALTHYVLLQVWELFPYLEDAGILEKTTIILTADHGEEFWDHEDYQKDHYDCGHRSKQVWLTGTGHGHTLFNEIVHVPLLFINPPFCLDRKGLSWPVSISDIFPTILDVSGLDTPGPLDGRSLARPVLEDREILVESTLYGFERKAMIQGRFKHIHSPHENHRVVLDMANDPFESHPRPEPVDSQTGARLARLFTDRKQPIQAKEI